MADNQPHHNDIERVRDLLSPYLDGQVTDEERALVEQAVSTSTELSHELETLRQTVSLLAALPHMPAPRPFTLSEADVQPSPPVSKGFFGLPIWVRGWAVVAATLLCVLAIGGVFVSQLFGGLAGQQAAEIAFRDEGVASQAEAVEEPVEMEAPAEAAAEPALEQEMAPSEPAADKEVEILQEEEPAAEEVAEDRASFAGEMAEEEVETEESQVVTQGQAARSAAETEGDTAAEGAIAATASPLPTAAAAAAPPVAEAVEEEALAVEEAAPPEAAAAESAPPLGLDGADDAGQEKVSEPNELPVLPRPVEIQNQNLQVSPGLIAIEGMIEAPPGTTLVVNLLRNGEAFDNWAEPTSRQTLVQPDGRFSLAIRAEAGRTDADLFEAEPAAYQIVITAVEAEEPVVASIFFDTFGSPAATEAPPSPQPTSTVVAQATITPLPTAIEAAPVEIGAEESPSQTRPIGLLVASLVLIGALVIVGIVVWLVVRKPRA